MTLNHEDEQATEPVPCLVCGKNLKPVDPGSTQPVGALMFLGHGQYGSDFDPFDGTELQVNVCDPCLRERSDRVLHVRTTTTLNWDVRPWKPEEETPDAS